jgi:DNA-binding MarR family transcriptional regulator
MKPQTYPRDILLLYLLGKTGRARRPWLLEGVAHYIPTVKNGRAGSMSRVLGRLLKAGLIQQLTPSKTPAQILRLTKDGEDLYRRIYRESPTASEATRLLEGHQPNGLEHAGLTLAAAHYLEKRGLVVRTAPPPLNLPGGRRLEADLQAIDPETGECIYLEAERGIGPAETRTAKWENHLAFQGKIYIITLEKKQTEELVAEVIALNRVGEVCATDLTYLQDMEHHPDLWRIKREIEIAEV